MSQALLQKFLRKLTFLLARIHYRTLPAGVENLPATGGALLVCNHITYLDTIFLSMASPRPIRFLSFEDYLKKPLLGRVLRLFGTIPVSPQHAKSALAAAARCVRAGELVCIFPEGHLTANGNLAELKSGFELIARRAACPVIVTRLDGLWGSIFSFAGGRFFTKFPHALTRSVRVAFAPPLATREATTARVSAALRAMANPSLSLPALSHWPEKGCLS